MLGNNLTYVGTDTLNITSMHQTKWDLVHEAFVILKLSVFKSGPPKVGQTQDHDYL